jgi:hypothetical protein
MRRQLQMQQQQQQQQQEQQQQQLRKLHQAGCSPRPLTPQVLLHQGLRKIVKQQRTVLQASSGQAAAYSSRSNSLQRQQKPNLQTQRSRQTQLQQQASLAAARHQQ